jgi:hypothetical protein
MAQSRLSQYMRVSPSYASSAATPPRCGLRDFGRYGDADGPAFPMTSLALCATVV